MRPVRAKALIINAFAPTGRFAIFQSVHPGRCPGLWAYWAFSPRCLTFAPLSSKSIHCLLLMLFDCSGYGEDAITSYNLLLYPNKKARKIALFSTQDCLVFQKDSFCPPKRILLLSKRTPFATQNEPFCNSKGLLLKIRWIFYTLQNKNDTNPRLPPCSCRSY